MTEVKYLGDGTAVLVLGDGPARSTSLDGGRTLTEVAQAVGFRLDPVEHFEHEALLDERPEIDPTTGLPVPPAIDPATGQPVTRTATVAPGPLGEAVGAPGSAGPAASPPAAAGPPTDPAGTHAGVEPALSRGEVQTAEQLQAEINRLTAERDALQADEDAEDKPTETAKVAGPPPAFRP